MKRHIRCCAECVGFLVKQQSWECSTGLGRWRNLLDPHRSPTPSKMVSGTCLHCAAFLLALSAEPSSTHSPRVTQSREGQDRLPASAPPYHHSTTACVCLNPQLQAASSKQLQEMPGSLEPSGRGPGELSQKVTAQTAHPDSVPLPTWRTESCSFSPFDLPFLPSHTCAFLKAPLGLQLHQHSAQPPQLSCWEWEALEPERGCAWEKPCTPPPLLAGSRRDRLELN